MSLDATVGGANSNSYATVAEGDSYFGDRLNSTEWTDATTGTKEKALVTATRRIDEEMFLGFKVTITQALKWPRAGVNDEDGVALYNSATPAIPQRIKEATFVAALELLKVDYLTEDYLQNFSFFSAGSVQFKQFTQQGAGRLPADCMRLLRFVMTSGSGSGRLVRA